MSILQKLIEQFVKAEIFITPKDHKENLINNLTNRLINPSKNDLGKISKHSRTDLANHLAYNQLKNTSCVIE